MGYSGHSLKCSVPSLVIKLYFNLFSLLQEQPHICVQSARNESAIKIPSTENAAIGQNKQCVSMRGKVESFETQAFKFE